MHFAVHGNTAAELIVQRANHQKEHMGLTSWYNAPHGMTSLAEVDIDGVLSYMIENLSNKTAAERLFFALNKTINNICEYPTAYPGYEHYFISDINYRHVIIGNYVLFYRADEEKEQIEILRFIYSGRNIGQSDIL